MTPRIRPATVADVPALAALARGLRIHQNDSPVHLTEEALRRDGFGAERQFSVFIAELGGEPVGYALFHDCYEPTYAARGVYLCDLFVKPAARRRGVGRALVAAVARDARERRRSYVWWVSRRWNEGAHALYRSLGAIEEPVQAHAVVFETFAALCREAAAIGYGSGRNV